MARKTAADVAVEKLEAEIAVLQAAKQRIVEAMKTQPKRKTRAVKVPDAAGQE